MPAFEITHQSDNRSCVVRLTGDIDTAVVPELRDDLAGVLDGGCWNLVLDLGEVTYADSSALGLLVWLDHELKPHNGRLVLAGANGDIGRILELSGLIAVAGSIGMSSDVNDALDGFSLPERPSKPEWSRKLDVPADVNVLSRVREQVSQLVAPLGFTESSLFDMKVALGEALANAVRHGTPEASDGQITVTIEAFGDRVVIEVADKGLGFDGTTTEKGDVYAPSGRGIMFMRALMDRVEFEKAPQGGTIVRLVKHRVSGEG